MSPSKTRENLGGMNERLEKKQKEKKSKPTRGRATTTVNPNPEHGEKGSFVKMTVSLSPDICDLLSGEVARRRRGKLGNVTTSAVIREAVVEYLGGKR